jgi:GDPmannose 4,6-dehydratase
VREWVRIAFESLDMDYRDYVDRDPALLRPAEVHHLRSDCSKARRDLGWEPKVEFEELIKIKVRADLERVRTNPTSYSAPSET